MSATAGCLRTSNGDHFDVVIVGGGIAGAGLARDLALRGISVALIEKADFGSGTTSRSSKLSHGGLRYLELLDFALVRESLSERERLRRLAPHLVRPLPFLVPVYRDSSRGLVKVRIGLTLYGLSTPSRDRERYRVVSAAEVRRLEPGLRLGGLRGAGYYIDDLIVSPERLCLENVLSAARHGARVVNYAEVEAVVRDAAGRPAGVHVRDRLTGAVATLRARIIVNATGPWVDAFRARAGVADAGRRVVRTTKGVHCLLPRLTDRAIYHSTADGRMIFVIPWRQFSLVGTTDTDFHGDLDGLHTTREEVLYLLTEVRRALPDPRVRLDNVAYTYAGVRPLSFEDGKPASAVSRAHRVVVEADGRFLSITGTKLTCFRSLAARLGDDIARTLGRRRPGLSHRLRLDGTEEEVERVEGETWLDVEPEAARSGLPLETVASLVTTYGGSHPRVVALARGLPGGSERLCPTNPEIAAQLHLAITEEFAVTLADVLLRRTGLGTSPCQGLDCAERVAHRMAGLLRWDQARQAAELRAYAEHVAHSHYFKHQHPDGRGHTADMPAMETRG